jgi:hypothetical protein
MPSMSGGALQLSALVCAGMAYFGFYALDVGRGFATQGVKKVEEA